MEKIACELRGRSQIISFPCVPRRLHDKYLSRSFIRIQPNCLLVTCACVFYNRNPSLPHTNKHSQTLTDWFNKAFLPIFSPVNPALHQCLRGEDREIKRKASPSEFERGMTKTRLCQRRTKSLFYCNHDFFFWMYLPFTHLLLLLLSEIFDAIFFFHPLRYIFLSPPLCAKLLSLLSQHPATSKANKKMKHDWKKKRRVTKAVQVTRGGPSDLSVYLSP